MNLDEVPVLECRSGRIPEKVDREHKRRQQSGRGLRLQRADQQHQVVGVMCAFHAPFVPLPLDGEIGIASVPCMRSGCDLLRARLQAPDKRIPEIPVAIERGVVFQANMNGQTFRQQHLGRHAVHIPCIPSARQAPLHLFVLCRTRTRTGLAGSHTRIQGRSLRV